jgi:hypothetical protein
LVKGIADTAGLGFFNSPFTLLVDPAKAVGHTAGRNALVMEIGDACSNILTDALGLLLGNDGKDVEEQLALAIHRVNALFFKNDRDAQLFQPTHHGHTVKHISGETGDGLGIDDVDFAIHAILNHLSEFRPTLRTASAAFIRIDLYEFLIGVIGEQLCEVAFLNLIGTFLTLHAGADSAIGRRPFLFHYNFHCVILLGVVV